MTGFVVLTVRRKGCDHRLAEVVRVADDYFVRGEKRAQVARTLTADTKHTTVPGLPFEWPLAEPPDGADILLGQVSCRHGSPTLVVSELRAAVAAAVAGGSRVLHV